MALHPVVKWAQRKDRLYLELQLKDILDEKVELERWLLTAQYVGAPDTRGHGLGDIRKLLVEQQVDEVVDVYGLKAKPSADGLFNMSMLPPKADRMVKA